MTPPLTEIRAAGINFSPPGSAVIYPTEKIKPMKIIPIRTKIFWEGENLLTFILKYVPRLKNKSILVVTSKIVALSEKRTVPSSGDREKAKLIRAESDFALPTKYVWLTIKDGMVMASAGVDESNANGRIILLPEDSFSTARLLRKELKSKFKLNYLGVLITDSRTAPLRAGITGATLGYAGFRGLKDYRGTPDIFGRRFHFSRVNIADSLASAAVLTMGEGREQRPLAIIEDAPVVFCDRIRKNELLIDPKEDMYRPLFTHWPKHSRVHRAAN